MSFPRPGTDTRRRGVVVSSQERQMRQAMVKVALGSLLLCAALLGARADDYPTRPIRLIANYPAGGVVDLSARVLGQRLTEILGQQVIIDNRPGAAGTIAANQVAKAPPDGYTLLLTPGDIVTMPSLMPVMAFDPHKDIVPIAMISSVSMVIVANVTAPFSNMKELIAAAKAQPGNITYATPGTGSINHVTGEWMATEADIKLLHVPYRGGVASANGVAAGDVALGLLSPSSGKPLIEAGRVRVIAVTGKKHSPSLPASWQTLDEAGLKVDSVLWNGLFAPAGTPAAVLATLEREVTRVLREERIRSSLNAALIDAEGISGADFAALIRTETARYDDVIRRTGVRIER
jgi:tripartite-type tricarboxylate transporter receptor subunit TctC